MVLFNNNISMLFMNLSGISMENEINILAECDSLGIPMN